MPARGALHPVRYAALLATVFAGLALWDATARADQATAGADGALAKPQWNVGDFWTIETASQRVQGREEKTAVNPPRIRWQFKVTNIEKVAGQDCYRIDVECLAQGRVRPKTTVWCDKETCFLRQFQTQLAFNGRYQTIQESYDCAKGLASPVVASINALPLCLPAFLPKGSKGLNDFNYTSQPLPAGSKNPAILRFTQSISQEIRPADAELAKKVYQGYSKDIPTKPLTQVTLESGPQKRDKIVQLWQAGSPWPVYVNNGRTQAWLVATSRK